MTTELRDPSLMTDAEWTRRYEALADSERAAMRQTAGALGVNLRHVDPAQYSAAYKQQQQELAEAEATEKQIQKLQQPIPIRPEISDRDLATKARRLGVNEQIFIANYNDGRRAEIQAEADRKEALLQHQVDSTRTAANEALEAFGRAVGAIE